MDTNCYVCFEPGGQCGMCSCTSLRIHKECQLKLVLASGNPRCGVCKTQFRNVEYKRSRRVSVAAVYGFGMVFVAYLFLTCAFLQFTTAHLRHPAAVVFFFVFLIAASISLTGGIWICVHKQMWSPGNAECVSIRDVSEV